MRERREKAVKVYHKKNFLWGVLLLLLGLLLLAAGVGKGFTLRSAVVAALLLFLGGGILLRSLSRDLSREDRVQERDERSLLVALRARGTAFRCAQGVCFLCLVAVLLGHRALGEETAALLALAFGGMWTVMAVSELAALWYHERHS